MRDLVLRWLWPNIFVVALAVALGVLTVVSWRSKRGSRLHGARLAVLAALVSLSIASCGGRENGTSSGQGNPPPPPPVTCYVAVPANPPDAGAVQPPKPDAGAVPLPVPSCYEPVAAPPPDAGTPPPMPLCYQPVALPPQGPDAGPGQAAPPPPDRPPVLCYRSLPPDRNQGAI